MTKLTGIIIAKNSEGMIEACLDSIQFCDEILVIDGGSTDKTITIAKAKGAKVISEASNDFSQQRNIGLRLAKGIWVFYIDTDERVTKELQRNILDAIASTAPWCAYRIQRKNFYLGDHPWPKVELLERLFKKDALQEWYGALHESARVTGKIGELSGLLYHYSHQDLSSMVTKTNQWSDVEATLRFEHKHPRMVSWRFFRVMTTAFYDSYIRQGGWRAGTAGLIESIYQAFSMFITYAKLWEMQVEKHADRTKRA